MPVCIVQVDDLMLLVISTIVHVLGTRHHIYKKNVSGGDAHNILLIRIEAEYHTVHWLWNY